MAQVIVARRGPLVVFQRGPSGAAKILAGNDTANAARFAGNSASSATLSQEWAEGTEPGGPGTKSSKGWAEESQAIADDLGTLILAGESPYDAPINFYGPDEDGRLRRYGRFRSADGAFTAGKWGAVAGVANGGLTVVTNASDELEISLGDTLGKLPIGTGGFIFDNTNPEYTLATTVTDRDGRVRRVSGVTRSGASDPEIVAARGDKASLSARLNVSQRADGLLLTERFNEFRLSEVRRKIGDIKAGAGSLLGADTPPYQLSINLIGNSLLDNPDFFITRVVRRAVAEVGDAGAGFGAVESGFCDPAVATVSRTGTWTVTDGSDGGDVPGPALIQIASSSVGAKWRVTQVSGESSSVSLLALANSAVVSVAKNGGAGSNVTLSAVMTDLGVTLAAGDYVEMTVVSGTVTLYGADLRRNQSGVRFNKLGNSSSTWADWLNATAATWQAGLTALGGDLNVLLEGVNGAYVYDADTEVINTTAMIARCRAALPVSDILLVSPPETLGGQTNSLRDFDYALRALAASEDVAHLSMQYAFGAALADYDDTGRGYFTAADPNHPSVKGRPVAADTLYRTIFN